MNTPPVIGPEAPAALADLLRQAAPSRLFVLADTNTARDCYPRLLAHLPAHELLTIEAGEEYKTLATCAEVWSWLTAHQADRHALLVCIGGGVVTDLGGFCAATYKRGIRCVGVPTTLLAQVDAAVGGKTGVDFEGFKNHIGVFQEPEAVFIYPAFLQTLPPRELRSGYAEVIKHALIADAPAFAQLHGLRVDAQPDWTATIQHSVAIKENIVTQDPHESGPRKLLNFGHTIGHAIESYLLTQPGREVRHGEAVAAGILCESWLSAQRNLLSAGELTEIAGVVRETFAKIQFSQLETEAIAAYATHDKKNRADVINCTLLHGIGRGVYDQAITLAEVRAALDYYHQAAL
ncbi:3-dehydroquinate synthase [Hymenobacter sp. HMF4947]|uniref:3-dehydroquinate synthase n=1 Tax=Hymenobacter ginkgonis TaxID=2682976 RepID=A0A7K1TAC0_9BACT|nr:3-dehydroquinate synthase [Hymenobacter ginkgonis]MVN75252.1 3-dehydroquinate synthase [Hymenobacter ginkgonis]